MTTQVQKKTDLFSPGMAGSKSYRIPSLLTTKKGTLIAGNDARLLHQRDNPNKINITVRRSSDNGETWSDIETIVEYPGHSLDSPAVIDTALVQNKETETIWMMFSHTPGGIGLWNSGPGVGFDENNKRQLIDNEYNRYVLEDNGTVVTLDNEKTDYTVDEKGFLYKGEDELGHIFEKIEAVNTEMLYELPTSYLQAIKSTDDGKTWSEPINLNHQVKEEWMRFIGTGPGRGIQLENGPDKGRLIIPIYYSNMARVMSCAVVYSDDDGATWSRSDSPNDNRDISHTPTSAEDIGTSIRKYELTECQAVELADGSIHLYMRNHYGNGRVARSVSLDGGLTWGELEFVEDLLNPVCQFSIINYPDADRDVLLFSGPFSENKRENGVLMISKNGGESFEHVQTIEKGSFVYSCLTLTGEKEVGILYETEDDEGRISSVFTEVSLNGVL